MNFEKGKNVKESLRVGVKARAHKVIEGHIHKLGETPWHLLPEHLYSILREYIKKGNFQNFPEELFLRIQYTNDEGRKTVTPALRIRALQGEWLNIQGEYFKVPNFPGHEEFHPDNYRP